MLIQPGTKLVMIGDSITFSGRSDSGEWTPYNSLLAHGQGYVSLVASALMAFRPEGGYRVINRGVSGNTVRDLKQRWQEDVLDLEPDWLSVMIGINDVWRRFDLPAATEKHVGPEEYRNSLEELLGQLAGRVKGTVVLSPFMIEPNRDDPMRKQMDQYGQIASEVAAGHQAIFVDVQAAFEPVLKHYHPAALAWDRIHPNRAGHMVIARAFLEAIGFDWS